MLTSAEKTRRLGEWFRTQVTSVGSRYRPVSDVREHDDHSSEFEFTDNGQRYRVLVEHVGPCEEEGR